MADFLTKRRRSELMSRVRSKGNLSTELRFIALFRKTGIVGWRRSYPLIGKPDFVFRRERVAVFVDGCFWHGCPRHYKPPGTRGAFWRNKVETNRDRDRRVTRALRKAGWTVLRVWEHDLAAKHWPRVSLRLARALVCATTKRR